MQKDKTSSESELTGLGKLVIKNMELKILDVISIFEFELDELSFPIKNLKTKEREKIFEIMFNNLVCNIKENFTLKDYLKTAQESEKIINNFVLINKKFSKKKEEYNLIADNIIQNAFKNNNIEINFNYLKSLMSKEHDICEAMLWIIFRYTAIIKSLQLNKK